MIPIHAQRKILVSVIFFVTTFLFFSCKKIDSNSIDTVVEPPTDFSKKVIASVNGFVINENNTPVVGAEVQYGEFISRTNQYGYFEIKNATVTENAGAVTVKISGYFTGVKTFIAQAGKNNFCRIKLIPKTNSGSVDAASGGNVSLSNGLNISLPPAGIIDAATQAPYSGTVSVSSCWINPTASDLDEIMPGDLRGINTNGSLKSLTSFGMAAVELTGNSGQLLQIADGKKATLTFPLENTIAAVAPASIPMWYFDEAKGLWIEEGFATKSGNTYVGEVKHFTYWNCDLPNATIPLSFTVRDSLLRPLGNVHVDITPLTGNSPWSHVGGYTDETGYVNVPVTANTQYKLQFLNSCLNYVSYSKEFTVDNQAVDLGNITVGTGSIAVIVGTATSCNNTPLSNGQIMLRNDDYLSITTTNTDGVFSYSTFMCNNTSQYDFIAEDRSSSQQGQAVTFTINAGTNNIGNLQACGISTNEYSNLTINGKNYILGPLSNGIINSGAQSFNILPLYGTSFNVSLSTQLNGAYINYGDQVSWSLTHSQIIGTTGSLNYLNSIALSPGISNPNNLVVVLEPLVLQTATTPGSVPITITEYGGIGEFISGYFNDTLYSRLPNNTLDTTNPYHVIYNFSIKRYY